MKSTTKPENAIETIDAFAREIAAKCPDVDRAASTLMKRIHADKLEDPIIAALCRRAAESAIHEMRSRSRVACKTLVTRRTIENSTAYGVATGILDVWMVGVVRLGDATRGELADAAEKAREQAEGHLWSARFYEALIRKLPNDSTTVRDVLDADAASKLLDAAKGGKS